MAISFSSPHPLLHSGCRTWAPGWTLGIWSKDRAYGYNQGREVINNRRHSVEMSISVGERVNLTAAHIYTYICKYIYITIIVVIIIVTIIITIIIIIIINNKK